MIMTDMMEMLAAQADPGVRIGVFAESLHAEETPELRELERKALGVPRARSTVLVSRT